MITLPLRARPVAAAAALLAVAAPTAPALTVDAAASLSKAFPALDRSPSYQFAGSDTLALQIERGAPVDVFASASPKEAERLFRAGRCGRPAVFATNVLVLVVPRGNPAHIRSVGDLARGARHRLAVGTPTVPVGAYTRLLLRRLHLGRILTRNLVSSETSVSAVVAKVALGGADAGFVYATDARAAGRRVRTIRLPASVQPPVRYEICAVRRRGARTAQGQAFIRRVLGPTGRVVLRRYGFGLPALR